MPVIEELPVPGGAPLVVRTVEADDADALTVLYAGISDDDRYRRFFSHGRVHPGIAQRWIAQCREHGLGLVVEETAPVRRVVAEAGYALTSPGEGELAMTIAADRRGWLGPYLLDLLVRLAAERGVQALEADVLLENRRMLGLLRHRGAVGVAGEEFPVVRLRIGTGEGRSPWPADRRRPRVLVEAAGLRWQGAERLHAAGLDVLTCPGPGPGHHASCPLDTGGTCPLAEGADAVVVAVPPGDDRRARLLAGHARAHPDVVVVVDGGGPAVPSTGTASCPAPGGSVLARVLAALPDAVLSQSADQSADQPDGEPPPRR